VFSLECALSDLQVRLTARWRSDFVVQTLLFIFFVFNVRYGNQWAFVESVFVESVHLQSLTLKKIPSECVLSDLPERLAT
jgi:hypothetical protein